MKILWFYRYNRYYNKDEELHAGFIKAVSQHPDVEVKVYGPYLEDVLPELLVKTYKQSEHIDDVTKDFKPDVILMTTKSRMFKDYNPHNGEESTCWLPYEWNTLQVPRVILEEDFFYERNDDWYFKNNIAIILNRHYSQSKRITKCKNIWFPFSVDINKFKPDNSIQKTNKICFAGALGAEGYMYRRMAVDKLKSTGMIDVFSNGEKQGEDYIKCLQEYTCQLAGTLKYNITPAKIFEIMACGGVLLVNDADNGMYKLFPRGGYVHYNSKNIVQKAYNILNGQPITQLMANEGRQDILEYHSHFVRIQQLVDLIKKEFNCA